MSTLADVIIRDLAVNQPAAGIEGRIFFASDTGAISRDNGATWDDVTPGVAAATWASAEVPAGAVNGTDGTDGNVTFTLTQSPSPAGDLLLVKQGIVLKQGTAYTLAGNTITYLTGYKPITGDLHVAYPYRY